MENSQFGRGSVSQPQDLFLEQPFEILTGQSWGAILRQTWLARKVKLIMTIEMSSTKN